MFQITGLPVEPFVPLFGLSDAELSAHGACRVVVEQPNAAPCRIGLADAAPGETVILTNYTHLPGLGPYRSSHAIYVREGAVPLTPAPGQVPDMIRRRPLSIRAFDSNAMMIDADLVDGADAGGLIDRLLADPAAAFLHIHFARRGCYAARVDRVRP